MGKFINFTIKVKRGKHLDKDLLNVPTSYLQWVLDNFDDLPVLERDILSAFVNDRKRFHEEKEKAQIKVGPTKEVKDLLSTYASDLDTLTDPEPLIGTKLDKPLAQFEFF